MHRFTYLFLSFFLSFFLDVKATVEKSTLSQTWIQIQTNEDGSKSYYNKQLINENGNYKEVELDYHTFVSRLNLVNDSSYENSYLNFEYSESDYGLPANWNGKWWCSKKKDSTFLNLQTQLSFLYGFDPIEGSNLTPPGPKEIVFKFYITEISSEVLKLELINQGYFRQRKLEFISEKHFLNELKRKHKKEIDEYNAVFYQDLEMNNKREMNLNGKVFSGKAICYYENGRIFKNLNKLFIQEYSEGKLDGVSTHFFPQGNIHAEYTYANGEKNGKYVSYSNVNGKSVKSYQGEFKDGEMDGEFTYYDKNGHRTTVSHYKQSKQHGTFLSYKYYEGKELKVVEGQYVEGSKDGEWRYYNESGEKIITETYENGNLVKKEKEVDFEGKWNATKQMVNESGDVCSQYSYLLKINEKGLISKHTGAENYQNAGFIEQTASIFKKFTFDWSENTEYRFKKIDDNTYQLTRNHPPKPHPHLYKKNAPTSDPVITPEGNTKAPYKICETEVWTFKRLK